MTLPYSTLKGTLQEILEKEWQLRPFMYLFNRYDMNVYTMSQDLLSWSTPPLFTNYDVAPIIFVFWQTQDRTAGTFSKSIHKFETPGGYFDQDKDKG